MYPIITIMDFLLFILLSLVAIPKWTVADIQLVSSGPGTLRPGESLRMACKVTGVSISDSRSVWNWIRQPPGKGLEWMARIYPHDGRTWYSSSLQSRTTISSDSSKNAFSLQLNALTAGDSAMYYCARDMDYWGQGTMVTVTSASPSAPSLFPLIPSGSMPDTGDINVGCMAKDFLPQPVTFSWDDQNNASIAASKFKSFPAISSTAGTFTTSSQAAVPVNDWKNFRPFYCKADHTSGNTVARVIRQTSPPTVEPEMLIRAPPILAFSNAYLNSTITCSVAHLCTDKTTLQWFKNGELLDSGFTTTKPVSDGQSGYNIMSKLIVTKRDWLGDNKYACKVENEKFNNTLEFSKNAFCLGNPQGPGNPMVETIAPNYADIYQTSSANLTCRISNIPFDADLSLLEVTWMQGPNKKPLETVKQNPTDQENELQSIDATATVCATDWNKGEIFTCKVAFSGLFPEPVEKTLQKDTGGPRSAPSVYMLYPASDELALKETATITCLVKNFYPTQFFVKWLHNDQPLSGEEQYTSEPIQVSKKSKLYSAFSMLTINEQDWNAGDKYTCMVGHEQLPYNTTQKTADKSSGKPSVYNVSLVLSDSSNICY